MIWHDMTQTHKSWSHFQCLVFDIWDYIYISGRTIILFWLIHFSITGSDIQNTLFVNIIINITLQITLVTYLHYDECQTYGLLAYRIQLFHIIASVVPETGSEAVSIRFYIMITYIRWYFPLLIGISHFYYVGYYLLLNRNPPSRSVS